VKRRTCGLVLPQFNRTCSTKAGVMDDCGGVRYVLVPKGECTSDRVVEH